MFGSAVLEVAAGLIFMYALLALVVSAMKECLSNVFKMRGRVWEHGVARLFGDENRTVVARLLVTPAIAPLCYKDGRSPSYVASEQFVQGVIQMLAGVERAASGWNVRALRQNADTFLAHADAPGLKRLLDGVFERSGDNGARIESELKIAYEAVMDRASGWYARRTRAIVFVITVLMVGATNADSIEVARVLVRNDAVRTMIADSAGAAAVACAAPESPACLKLSDPSAAVGALRDFPLGWTEDSARVLTEPFAQGRPADGLRAALQKAAGILLTVFAVGMGAPFWFRSLQNIARIRGSGPRPAPQPDMTPVGANPVIR